MNFKNKITIIFSKNTKIIEDGHITGILSIHETEDGKLNLFKETFLSALYIWKKEDYLLQWKLAFERLDYYESSCLVVNVNVNPFVELWTIHKKENVLYIYNNLYFEETFPEIRNFWPITPENSFNFIRPYESFSKDASCWKVIL